MVSIKEAKKTVSRPEKVLQFGEGNFLRAFVDWQIDIANEKTDFNGNVVLVQPLERGLCDMINDQNGLYTTVLRGVQDGKTVADMRTITSVSRCVNAYAQYDEYMKCAENPDLRFVISNTTEAGISYSEGCKLEDTPPQAFPAKVAQFLYRRYTAFNGDTSKGLVFIPCELIDKNGTKLREFVIQYAKEWNLPAEFIAWVENACDFCNSLVDRIVPGYPREEADALCEKLGYKDNLLDTAEIFHLWVIETKKDYTKEFPLAAAGLNVVWTEDMSFYRTRKVRILNGTHTMFVPAAFQYGLDTVKESIDDETMLAFIKKGLFEEIIPSMDGSKAELEKYAGDVLERFANPYIKHMLLDITLNSVSKFKTRDLPSVLGYMDKMGKVPEVLSFSIAALTTFYNGKGIKDRAMTGIRNGAEYPIRDDESILEFFETLYAKTSDAKELAKAVLSNTAWWGDEDLTKKPGLEEAVATHIANIQTKGMKQAVAAIVNK
ncbi:MAG: tagaturonate reductase [Spirochaetaceae bacterium]|nr:tagaturonate reductase [Spirochaetaceae bacterium]